VVSEAEASRDAGSPCVTYQPAHVTVGDYQTEQEACSAFDEAALRSGAFKLWKEVPGEMIHPLPGNGEKQRYRIDRVLVPTEKLVDAGWTKGLIGVEIKKSDVKAGPPLSQSLDYLRCAWTGPLWIRFMIGYVFLFPMEKTQGTIASLMAQNHFGTCRLNYDPSKEWHRLEFFLGEQPLIECFLNTGVIKVKNTNVGNKTGSR
jgi:hypothetical protein